MNRMFKLTCFKHIFNINWFNIWMHACLSLKKKKSLTLNLLMIEYMRLYSILYFLRWMNHNASGSFVCIALREACSKCIKCWSSDVLGTGGEEAIDELL